jgi:hypothetical protein
METDAATEQITSHILHDTADNFVVNLQRVHEVKGYHIKHVFT